MAIHVGTVLSPFLKTSPFLRTNFGKHLWPRVTSKTSPEPQSISCVPHSARLRLSSPLLPQPGLQGALRDREQAMQTGTVKTQAGFPAPTASPEGPSRPPPHEITPQSQGRTHDPPSHDGIGLSRP